MRPTLFTGATLFDGEALRPGVLAMVDGYIVDPPIDPLGWARVDLVGGILAPGFVDLQVNGGGGVMVDGTATVESLRALCGVHARLGATAILPTLITDRPDATRAVIAAGIAAARAQVPGFLGLHLEGPHLDPLRKGAHDPALIRPMEEGDLAALCEAARHLPVLVVTLAPASVRPDQIATLARAGVIVSLGHADCTHAEAVEAHRAGARMVTHLFNAMSPLTGREPGLVGAALGLDLDAGLIADGVHVHPASIALALSAKRRGRVFLVSDAMAVAGSDLDGFYLGGRRIQRAAGRLTLADGTLAGADLTLSQAVAVMAGPVGLPLADALAMATRLPAEAAGVAHAHGHLIPGRIADIVHLTEDLTLAAVWRGGIRL